MANLALPLSLAPFRRRAVSPVLLGASLLLLLVAALAVAPGLFTGTSPTATDPLHALRAPGPAHWFGTDQLGRDQFTRVVYGARPSLLVGLGATVLAVAGGVALGLTAGLSGKAADQVLMRACDTLLALPQLLQALLVVTVLGHGTVNLMLAVGIVFVPGYARIVRAETMVVRASGYVEAAAALGLRRRVLILRHILPNALGPLLVVATVGFGAALISASSLSFLGMGVQPPTPEWGALLSQGRDFLQTAWWLGVFPGASVTVTVIAVNTVGRAVQARFTRRTGA